MSFSASDNKGRNFLEPYGYEGRLIEPEYKNGGPWLRHVGHSNSICAQLTHLITNHTSIGEYRKRFFPNKDHQCSCGLSNTETRDHILFEYNKYNIAWRPQNFSILSIITFLIGNANACCFDVHSRHCMAHMPMSSPPFFFFLLFVSFLFSLLLSLYKSLYGQLY